MKISELINKLIELKAEIGDVPVCMSSDSEGNSFATLDKKTSLCPIMNNSDIYTGLCIFPFEEGFRTPECATKFGRK